MAETTQNRAGQIIKKLFAILVKHPDGLSARHAIESVATELDLTEYEKSFYPSRPDVRRFDKIVRFSTIGPVKAGWITKNKGLWSITEAGIAANKHFADPAELMRESGRLYRMWKRDQIGESTDADDTAEEVIDVSTTLEEAEETSWAEVEQHLAQMNPYDFQELVAGLLRGMKYHVSWIAPAGPDKGVDIIAHVDPLGIEKGRIKVQVKRRADKIAVTEIRSFLAVLGDEDVGIFVTTAGFTSDAEAEARMQERRRIMLLDAKKLFDLWIEYYDTIPEAQRRLMPLRPVYFLASKE